MKKTMIYVALAGLLASYGCSSDTKTAAEKANEKKIDSQSGAISDDAKSDAKEVAKSMVELTSMGMTELEMSRLAVQNATNPQVKGYALQVMTKHQQDERELRNLASQLTLTLPAGLSDDGKDRLEDLKKQTGTAFDLEYLKEMADVNDQAVDIAEDLEDNAPNDAVKKLAEKLLTDDRSHRDQAKQLRNVLD